ncbi:MAG: HEAT repeat domain-containing protein [Gemmataceae bacterium]|nr:HEAT repeat domain-containing protein [Gemmataceae bacterium]
MNPQLAGVVVCCWLGLALGPVLADQFDINQPQSPPKPLPKWIKAKDGKQVLIDQGQFDPRLKGLRTPEGFKVEIVADYPTVVNPVGMTFADDGALVVLEWLREDPKGGPTPWNEFAETFTYKDGTKRQVATMKKKVKDVVKVLRDTKGKGVFDEAKVIIEDELPSSVLLHDGWIYLSGRGTVRRFKQSKANGPYDVKEIIAQGFCGFHHHQVSGLTLGNDGWLYITSGDDDNYVEGSDGSRATALRTGAVFRCRPDGSKMHVYSLGYRNPYRDVAFDSVFNCFHADNDNEDGSKFMGCRLMHVAEESDFGWRLFQGARCCKPDPIRGAAFGELPGKLAPMLKTGRGAPAGLLIYNDTRLPEQYQGLLYYPDVYRKLVRAYKVGKYGATFSVTAEFEFMKSDDPLFRPCQMILGPDGAMYICDWRTDSGGAGQLAGDGLHGRIYRVSWAGTEDEPAIAPRGMDSWAKIARLTEADLLQTLGSEDQSDRLRAQHELVKRGASLRPKLLAVVLDIEIPLRKRIACLGALQSFWNEEVQAAFLRLLREGEPDLRRLAADGLSLNGKPGDVTVESALIKVMGDQDPGARRAIALALGRLGSTGAADALVNAFKFDNENDAYLHDGLLRAIERVGKPGIERLVALAESGVDKDREKVIDAFLTLRSRAAADALPTLLNYRHNSADQRVGLIKSYSNYLLDPPVSLTPLAEYLDQKPNKPVAVKLAAVEMLASAGLVKGDKMEKLVLALLDVSDVEVRLPVIRIVEQSRVARAAPRLAELLKDGKLAVNERTAAIKALRVLNDKSAAPVVKEIVDRAGDGTPETIQFRIEALRTLLSLDGTQGTAAAERLLDAKEVALQAEAVTVLGAQPAGARLAAERFVAKKLPRELLPQVSDALRKHLAKNPDLNKLHTEVMKGGLLVSLDKPEIERVEKLVKAKGNPQIGRALYLDAKVLACIKCHRLEGVGGNVGPDLTRLWDTHSIEKIMESMIDPSKEIKEGYQTFVATTKKGQVFQGLKVSQNADEVVLRDANAQDVRIATKDLEELVASKQSLMPDNVVSQLSYDQFIHLVAFLKDKSAQESLRGTALEFWVVGPFAGDPKIAHPPESKVDLAAKYPGMKQGEDVAWQVRQTDPTGMLNLRSVFNRERTTGYALTYVYSPKAQKVQMLIGASDAMKVWVNGEAVHEHAKQRPARADADKVAVSLKEGWNPVLLKVSSMGVEQALYLRVVGAADLRLSVRPDAK